MMTVSVSVSVTVGVSIAVAVGAVADYFFNGCVSRATVVMAIVGSVTGAISWIDNR